MSAMQRSSRPPPRQLPGGGDDTGLGGGPEATAEAVAVGDDDHGLEQVPQREPVREAATVELIGPSLEMLVSDPRRTRRSFSRTAVRRLEGVPRAKRIACAVARDEGDR